jgi:hypothetical protein
VDSMYQNTRHSTQVFLNSIICGSIFIKTDHPIHTAVTGRGGPQGCEMSRLPHFPDNRITDGGEVVSLTSQQHFTPGIFLVLISVRG